jgi:hypothetical protein
MKKPIIPENEASRQRVLDDLEIVYTPAEERFDRITRVAKRLFDVPIVLISLVNENSQWFKSCQGLTVSETSRDISFCGHAILGKDTFIISNAVEDPDFKDNPLVTGEPHIRFYAGQPITFFNHNLGTLCIIDTKPRQLDQEDIDSLRSLTFWVQSELLTWRNARNTYIETLLQSNQRDVLLDTETGDLNADGMDMVLSSIYHETTEKDRPLCIKVELRNLDQFNTNKNPALRASIKKAFAGSIRVALKDRGLMGMNSLTDFVIILSSNDENNGNEIFQNIEQSLSTFNILIEGRLFSPDFQISFMETNKT